ncbi:hypothetical protein [Microcoleus sp. herbarium12]|uniref:hypothetical protein n=1 Tax=Microcoleus sp. herbarium12 TaxID=3055437 RepID=UPI002FD05DC6
MKSPHLMRTPTVADNSLAESASRRIRRSRSNPTSASRADGAARHKNYAVSAFTADRTGN